VCPELTEASALSALQAATSWKAVSAHSAMLVSFILYMPRQCRRQSLPVVTHFAASVSRALYFGGCIDSPVSAPIMPWAKASMVFLLVGFELKGSNHPLG